MTLAEASLTIEAMEAAEIDRRARLVQWRALMAETDWLLGQAECRNRDGRPMPLDLCAKIARLAERFSVEIERVRFCACGCGKPPATGRRTYATDACAGQLLRRRAKDPTWTAPQPPLYATQHAVDGLLEVQEQIMRRARLARGERPILDDEDDLEAEAG